MKPPVKEPMPIDAMYPLPWVPAKIRKDEARAIQAVGRGEGSDIQQKKAISVIISRICAADDMEFRPDDKGGERATVFAGGKRFAGEQIRKWVFATGTMIEDCPD